MSDMLLTEIVDEEYKSTGITAVTYNNALIVIYNVAEKLDINEISKKLFNLIKRKNPKTSGNKYLAISAVKINEQSRARPHAMALY